MTVRTASRVLGLPVLALGLTLLVGCQQDNEAAVKLQENETPKVKGAPTRNLEEYAKQRQGQQANPYGKSGGYPGAR